VKKHVNYRLSEESLRLLGHMAKRRGLTQTAMIELLIHLQAEREEQESKAKQPVKPRGKELK
jgi:hypothetical protein